MRRGERDDVLVEERVARLHAVGHGHAVALLAEQQARQLHLVAEIERAVQRMPTPHALEVEVEVLIGDVGAELFLQPRAVIAVARRGDEIVEDRLRVRATDHGVDAAERHRSRDLASPICAPRG